MTPHDAARTVREEAIRRGFSHCGIADAQGPFPEGARLGAWLARGYHAGMSWMERSAAKRADPSQVLPGVRSIVVVAAPYHTPERHSENPSHGKISRYAWGEDYHRVVGDRLEGFLEWLHASWPGERSLWYVDTGPVMEKAWAQHAGLGWVGKHTNLITRDRGSWVFLGVVLTTLPLAADETAADHCGTCTLCLDACPTGALVEPYLLDAGRCISYLTIEHRGPIPEEFRGKFENWIFGCDICQDVCPWNGKAPAEAADPAFRPVPGMQAPLLEEWGGMTEEEFAARFTRSPLRRPKREGLLRSIAFVRGEKDADPDLPAGASHHQ